MSKDFYEFTKELSAEDLMKLLNTSAREYILSFSAQDITRDFPELNKGGVSC